MSIYGKIKGLAGTVVRAVPDRPVTNFEVARVGMDQLLGEVIRIEKQEVDIQVYEDIDGVHVGDPVEFTGRLLEIDLGPGLLGNVLDGIGRPLNLSEKGEEPPVFLRRGFYAKSLDIKKEW